MSRKRRRSQVFPAEDEHDVDTEEVHISGEEHDSEEQRKEVEIWDAFKEEHHESTPTKNILTVRPAQTI